MVDSIATVVIAEVSDLSWNVLGSLSRVEGDFSSKLSSWEDLVTEPLFGLKYSSMFADLVAFGLGVAGLFWGITASTELRISDQKLLMSERWKVLFKYVELGSYYDS